MVDFPLLSVMIFGPLIGVLLMLPIRGEQAIADQNVKHVALFTSLFIFAFSFFMVLRFEPMGEAFQFVERYEWFKPLGLQYFVGVDGISVLFILLAAFLTPVCILASWDSITSRVKEYMMAFLVLESFMIGTFAALDTVLFYVFFEAVLLPMFLIIGIWGGKRRIYAAYKFFLYTLFGSVLMLVAMITLYVQTGTTDIPELMTMSLDTGLQYWLWLAFFASFAIKTPMWPFHTWLPDAHVEAPTAGSVILAGVLLKMGGYGFMRFSLPIFPEASAYFADMMFWLSAIAVVYTTVVALVQEDMKKLIAYFSVAHMGFVTIGIFSGTVQGIEGALFQMLSHGLLSGALFLCVGVLYDRLHTREITSYGGISANMPRYGALFILFMLGSVSLPGTSGFVGEFLVLVGVFQVDTVIAVISTTGLVLGAACMLLLYRRIFLGPQVHKDAAAMPDINTREWIILTPLAVLMLWFGVFPGVLIDKVQPSVERILERYNYEMLADEEAG